MKGYHQNAPESGTLQQDPDGEGFSVAKPLWTMGLAECDLLKWRQRHDEFGCILQ